MATKTIFTHLLAAMFGVALMMVWPDGTGETGTPRDGTAISGAPQPLRDRPHGHHPSAREKKQMRFIQEVSRQVTKSDFDAWIESMSGEPGLKGQALAIAGLLTEDAELVRQGIEADPTNPYLLFIGANLDAFNQEERLKLSERLLEADPDNALAAYIAASQNMSAGNQTEALKILRAAETRSEMEDFNSRTQLLMKDALIASGLSPEAAGFRSTFEIAVPYLGDMRNLAMSLKNMEASMTPQDAAEARRMAAAMGYRLSSESKSTTMINHLVGISLELSTLEGLPDDASSFYEGLNVGQARETIQAERQELRNVINQIGGMQDQLLGDPNLMERYTEFARVEGEVEAAKWLLRTMQTKR